MRGGGGGGAGRAGVRGGGCPVDSKEEITKVPSVFNETEGNQTSVSSLLNLLEVIACGVRYSSFFIPSSPFKLIVYTRANVYIHALFLSL